jgi:hypothetical protein
MASREQIGALVQLHFAARSKLNLKQSFRDCGCYLEGVAYLACVGAQAVIIRLSFSNFKVLFFNFEVLTV